MKKPAFPILLTLSLTAGAASAQGFNVDWCPVDNEIVLDTNFTQITPCGGGAPINVAGGIFYFRDVTISANTTVRAIGPNPLVFICAGSFRVFGKLSVNGGDGTRVDTLQSANFPSPGGIGVCGGGNGGDGSPNSTDRSFAGAIGENQSGFLVGGQGGNFGCRAIFNPTTGSGGGGGTFSTVGDLDFRLAGLPFVQMLGNGGTGAGNVAGGLPGMIPFVDTRSDNNFIGRSYDFFSNTIVNGELSIIRGGQGGGGGGDSGFNCIPLDPQFVNDEKGGGGGAGGGAVIIYSAEKIFVGPQGLISANGGDGGGGEQAGSNNRAGGGGGGAGGLLVLASPDVELHTHGETYANDDFSFSLSADGGISKQGDFQNQEIFAKYPPAPRSYYTNRATGGFGGMGIIQIMSPLGNNSDGTNTYLDDSITIVQNGVPLQGAEKQRYLGWEGWEGPAGVRVDDNGTPIGLSGGTGDMRPAPVLQPLVF